MLNGPPTISNTTITQKPTQAPIELCFPKNAEPLPADLDPLPPFVTTIDCGIFQYCEPINDTLIRKHFG